jgi:Mn2+/Fe2+ NRAMP family transporter
MTAIQEIAGTIGRVSGKGIGTNLRLHYPRVLLYSTVSLLLIANTLNIGADLGAMGEALELLFGIRSTPFVVLLAGLCVILEVFLPYKKYVPILRWLVMALFAYVITAFIVEIPWGEALTATLIPQITFTKEFLMMLIAVIGTTISPYLFFWQSAQEVEEIHATPGERPLIHDLLHEESELRKLRVDTILGMALSNIVTFFIILTTAATLHANGVGNIQTAADAAKALEPLAGKFASLLFATGIIGTGLLAIPVLAGSAAYGAAEALHLPTGLDRRALKAKGFYGVITAATVIGLFLNFLGIDPIKALIGVAVINGIVSVPLMALLVHMASNRKVMGPLTIHWGLRWMGWLTTLFVTLASIGYFVSF